jgi:hypothetical protein
MPDRTPSRWERFTAMELATILGALSDSGGMRSSRRWYERCSKIREELTGYLVPPDSAAPGGDGLAGGRNDGTATVKVAESRPISQE